MLWNELDYETQMKIIDRMISLLQDEDNDLMQDGIMAAVHELETWSNSPLEDKDIIDNEPFVAQAQFNLKN
jgi:hypothetical protein